MEIEDKKDTRKHIGKEKPLPSNSNPKPSSRLDNQNSNGSNNTPLKPEETRKDIGEE